MELQTLTVRDSLIASKRANRRSLTRLSAAACAARLANKVTKDGVAMAIRITDRVTVTISSTKVKPA